MTISTPSSSPPYGLHTPCVSDFVSTHSALVAYAPGGRPKESLKVVPWRDHTGSSNLTREGTALGRNPHAAPACDRDSGVSPASVTTLRSSSPGSPAAQGARDPKSGPVGLISKGSARTCSVCLFNLKTSSVLMFHRPVSNQDPVESANPSGQDVIKQERLIGVEIPEALLPRFAGPPARIGEAALRPIHGSGHRDPDAEDRKNSAPLVVIFDQDRGDRGRGRGGHLSTTRSKRLPA